MAYSQIVFETVVEFFDAVDRGEIEETTLLFWRLGNSSFGLDSKQYSFGPKVKYEDVLIEMGRRLGLRVDFV